jgi:hypothetical protein
MGKKRQECLTFCLTYIAIMLVKLSKTRSGAKKNKKQSRKAMRHKDCRDFNISRSGFGVVMIQSEWLGEFRHFYLVTFSSYSPVSRHDPGRVVFNIRLIMYNFESLTK